MRPGRGAGCAGEELLRCDVVVLGSGDTRGGGKTRGVSVIGRGLKAAGIAQLTCTHGGGPQFAPCPQLVAVTARHLGRVLILRPGGAHQRIVRGCRG